MDQLFTFLLVAIWPLIGLLFGWWGSFLLLSERSIVWGAVIGFVGGLVYGVMKWQETKKNLYVIGWLPLVGTVSFYAAGMFGFFMGVPVFHCLLGIPAGCYWGRRMKLRQFSPATTKKQRRRLIWIVGGEVAMVAIASGLIAWFDPYTLANLQGMFQLQLTRLFLALVIWIGGFLLVGTSMLVTRLSFMAGQR